MFGIGFGELVIFLVVILIAVGPEKMPTFMKAVGKGLREFRRATRELRSSVGIDEILRDEDLKELRKPLDLNAATAARRPPTRRPAYDLTDDDAEAEFPADGTDIVHLREHPPGEAAPHAEPGPEPEAEEGDDDVAEPAPVAREDAPADDEPPEAAKGGD